MEDQGGERPQEEPDQLTPGPETRDVQGPALWEGKLRPRKPAGPRCFARAALCEQTHVGQYQHFSFLKITLALLGFLQLQIQFRSRLSFSP